MQAKEKTDCELAEIPGRKLKGVPIIAVIALVLLSAASARAQSGWWTPRCETLESTNCYLWLRNPNGLYSHIYQGGPPNCSKGIPGGYDPSQNPACLSRAVPPLRPRPRTFVTCPWVLGGNDAGFLSLASQTAPAIQVRQYAARTRDYNGNPIGEIRNVCVQDVKGSLQLTTPDGRFQMTRVNDISIEVPKFSYGAPAFTYETLAVYQLVSLAKGGLLSKHVYTVRFNVATYEGRTVGFDAYYYDKGEPLRSDIWLFPELVSSLWPKVRYANSP
jgi:hypothetical protein